MLAAFSKGLAWLGARCTRAVAISAIVGLCLPPLSALARPFVEEAVFALLVLAFIQVDLTAVRRHLRRPGLLAAALVWMMIVIPLAAGLSGHAFGLAVASPELMLALFIVTATTPIMSAPAFAHLLRLDGALSLTVLVLAMIAAPITAPLIATVFFADALPISATGLALRLGFLLAGSLAVAVVIRKIAGEARIRENRPVVDGLNVVLLFVFAVAVMDGVAANLISRPLFTAGIAALTVIVAIVQMLATMAVFFRVRRADAFTVALAVGNRNMGLMVAALASTIPDLTWLYFALAQLPIYFMPHLLKRFAHRISKAV